MTLRSVFRATAMILMIATALVAAAACVVHTAPPHAPRARPAPPLPPPPPPPPPVSVDIRFFYDRLRPWGDWVRVEPYGWVWAPNRVEPFWRPYTVGRWVWTDWGWTWVSDEEWGWATYHYGRWQRVPRHGWVWVPGTEWGPAWVAWRHGGGVVGWAPLPPKARFRAGFGIDLGGVDIDVVIGSDWWCFVDTVRFVEPGLGRWVRPVGRNATLVPRTAGVTRVRVVENRIVNDGLELTIVERATNRKLRPMRIVESRDVPPRGAVVEREDVRVYRPRVDPGPPDARPEFARERAERRPATRPEAHEAEKRWDDRWENDWDKLQRQQKKDEREAVRRGAPSRTVVPTHRDENYQAAENARRELEAEKERAARRAERAAEAAEEKKEDDAKRKATSTRGKGKKK